MKFNYKTSLVSLVCYAFFLQAQAQQHKVTGTVSDAHGALPGVNVALKNKAAGTITNLDGEYAIQVQPTDTLIFSYVGYTVVVKPVKRRTKINVQLKESATALKQVVLNAGYYTTTERQSTGSIAKITAEEIAAQPLVSPLQSLQGRVAGVQILPTGNMPGAAPTIRIRGQGSLRTEGNYPLYIINGVPVSSVPLKTFTNIGYAGIDPLSTINLANIKSIEVLKGADATAIYGSRGANGVVLITTKKARGKEQIHARIYAGVATVPNKLDLLNTQEYLKIRRKAFENDEVVPDEYNAYDLLLWDQDRYTDWQEFFLGGTANITNVNVSGTGGNEFTNFRLHGSVFKQGTIYPADMSFQKFTGGAQLHHHSKDQKLNMDLVVNYGINHNEVRGRTVGFQFYAFGLPPNAPPLFKNDGSLNWTDWTEAGRANPMRGYFNTATVQIHNLRTNLHLSYEVLSGLWLKTNLGYTHQNSEELLKVPKRSYAPSPYSKRRSATTLTTRKSWIVEPQAVYRKEWGKFKLEALAGLTFQESKSHFLKINARGYAAESLIGNLGAAKNLTYAEENKIDYRYSAVFGRVGVNWDQKYFLNFTGRRDGSSRFGPGNRFANFGAVGAAWIFSEASFFKNNASWLSFAKLRGSYGITGNDQISNYGYLDAYAPTQGPGGLYPVKLANPNYSWEVNKKLEVALQLGFLKDKFHLEVGWYRSRSSNQLVGYPLPATTGFGTVQANLGAMVENSGWEIQFTSYNIQHQDFQWQTSFNITFPKNELVRYPNFEQSSYKETYKVGYPLNIAFLYQYAGIDPDTGLYTVTDVNGDGNYDFQDRIVIQDRTRKYYGGINNVMTYKGFSLQFLWQFVQQEGTFATSFNAGAPSNQIGDVTQALGEQDPYQQISQTYSARRAYFRVTESDFTIENASFFRLKTLSLSYTLPDKMLQNIGITNFKLFLTGQNLWTLTDYPGMDPQKPIGGTAYTALRTITGGVQFNF